MGAYYKGGIYSNHRAVSVHYGSVAMVAGHASSGHHLQGTRGTIWEQRLSLLYLMIFKIPDGISFALVRTTLQIWQPGGATSITLPIWPQLEAT